MHRGSFKTTSNFLDQYRYLNIKWFRSFLTHSEWNSILKSPEDHGGINVTILVDYKYIDLYLTYCLSQPELQTVGVFGGGGFCFFNQQINVKQIWKFKNAQMHLGFTSHLSFMGSNTFMFSRILMLMENWGQSKTAKIKERELNLWGFQEKHRMWKVQPLYWKKYSQSSGHLEGSASSFFPWGHSSHLPWGHLS